MATMTEKNLRLAMLDTLRAIVEAKHERERAQLRLELASIVAELRSIKDGELCPRNA